MTMTILGYIKVSLPYEARYSTSLLNHPYVTAKLRSEMLLGIRNVTCHLKKLKTFKTDIQYHLLPLW